MPMFFNRKNTSSIGEIQGSTTKICMGKSIQRLSAEVMFEIQNLIITLNMMNITCTMVET